MDLDRVTLRLIKVEPRGFSNEWRTLYIPPDRYADAMEYLEHWQAHENPQVRWRDYTGRERAARINPLSDDELQEEIAYSLSLIDNEPAESDSAQP
jgi:hypothetical protein